MKNFLIAGAMVLCFVLLVAFVVMDLLAAMGFRFNVCL